MSASRCVGSELPCVAAQFGNFGNSDMSRTADFIPSCAVTSKRVAVLFAAVAALASLPASGQELPPPRFHHLRLNSLDPEAAIAFYARQFPSTVEGELGGFAGAPVAERRDGRCSTRSPPRHRSCRRPRSGISAGMSSTSARPSRPTRRVPRSSCCRCSPPTKAARCLSAATPGPAPAAFSG